MPWARCRRAVLRAMLMSAGRWPQAGMPEGVVLDVEERSLDRHSRVAHAGRRGSPIAASQATVSAEAGSFAAGDVERQPRCEEGPMVVSELKFVVPLNAGKLGAGQARPDLVSACPNQPMGGQLAEPDPFTADHPRPPLLGTILAELALLAADTPDTEKHAPARRGRGPPAPSSSTPAKRDSMVTLPISSSPSATGQLVPPPRVHRPPGDRPWTRPGGWRASNRVPPK